jgi:hypothetical protein
MEQGFLFGWDAFHTPYVLLIARTREPRFRRDDLFDTMLMLLINPVYLAARLVTTVYFSFRATSDEVVDFGRQLYDVSLLQRRY